MNLAESVSVEFEPGTADRIAKHLAQLFNRLPGAFPLDIFEPTYRAVDGAAHYVIGLKLRFPIRADERAAALPASDGGVDGVICHASGSFSNEQTP